MTKTFLVLFHFFQPSHSLLALKLTTFLSAISFKFAIYGKHVCKVCKVNVNEMK